MDDDDVNPEIRRALGAADARVDSAVRRLSRTEPKPRKKQPSLEDITADITEEISAVIRGELRDAPKSQAVTLKWFGQEITGKGRAGIAAVLIVAGLVAYLVIRGFVK